MKKILLSVLLLSVVGLSACSNSKTESLDSTENSKMTTKNSTKDSSNTKLSKKKTVASTSTSQSTSESIEYQASLSDFVGGWGVPNSGNIFFINGDGTVSTPMIGEGLITNTLENMSFSTLQDGRISFTSTVNGEPREVIKELDGTLTANGQSYYPYEKSIEEFQAASNSQEQNNTSSQEEQTAVYVEVQDGEGPNQFAERNGIPLETLFELNGIDSTSGIGPGMSLRIR